MRFSAHRLNLLLSERYNDMDNSKTLRVVASEIGISAGYLALLRNGTKTNPGPSVISKLARYFKVDPNELFERETGTNNSVSTTLKITLDLCDALISSDHVEKALDVLEELLSNQRSSLEETGLYESASLLRAVAVSRRGNSEDGLSTLGDFLQQGHLSPAIQALCYYERSRIYYRTSYFDKAIKDVSAAIELLQGVNDVELLRKCHYALGVYYGRVSRYALSIINYEKARDLAGNAGDIETAHIFLGLGQTYVLMNEPHIAVQHLLLAEQIYDAQNETQSIADVYHNLSRCKALEGNYSEANHLLNHALELHQQVQSIRGIAYDYMELARNSFLAKDDKNAKELARRASSMFQTINDEGQVARASLIEYESMLRGGEDLTPFVGDIEKIISFFETREWTKELGKSLMIYATILEHDAKTSEAIVVYKRLAEQYGAYFDKSVFTD